MILYKIISTIFLLAIIILLNITVKMKLWYLVLFPLLNFVIYFKIEIIILSKMIEGLFIKKNIQLAEINIIQNYSSQVKSKYMKETYNEIERRISIDNKGIISVVIIHILAL